MIYAARSRLSPFDSRTRLAQIFLKLPFATASGLARHDEVQAGHEGDELSATTGLGARVGRNASAAAAAFGPVPRGQLPALRKDLRIELPAQLGRLHLVRWRGRFIDKPFRDDLLVFPLSTLQHAVSDSGEIAR